MYHWHIHFMSGLKLKFKQDSWSYSHLGHCSLGGNLQVLCLASPPGICLLSTFNELYPFIFYRHYTMAEYAFFVQKADWWRKDTAPLWGNLNICPPLPWLAGLLPTWGEQSQQVSSIWVIFGRSTISSAENPNKEVKMEWSTLGCPVRNTPAYHYSLQGWPTGKASPTNLHNPSLTLLLNSTGQPPV